MKCISNFFTQDAYRATTGQAVRKARLGEIKHEMFTSEKLKVTNNIYNLNLQYFSWSR